LSHGWVQVPLLALRNLFAEAALRSTNLGGLTRGLSVCLDAYGAEALNAAMLEARAEGAPYLGAVRKHLERRRTAEHKPPPLAVHLPQRPEVRNLIVRPQALESYDDLKEEPASEPAVSASSAC
jgi:hypothetical protein